MSGQAFDLLLEKVIFNAISILVGLSIAIVGIFLGSINSLYLSLYRILRLKEEILSYKEISEIKSELKGIVSELKQNSLFSICIFLIAILLFFVKEMDIPGIKWFIESEILTKHYCVNSLILLCTFLIFWSIVDSILVIFKLTDAFELIKD